jgi:hypothetical protein
VVQKGGFSVKIKRQEPPNGGFGQGTVVCGRIHGEVPNRQNSDPARFAKDSLEKSSGGGFFGCGRLRGQVYSKTRMQPLAHATRLAINSRADVCEHFRHMLHFFWISDHPLGRSATLENQPTLNTKRGIVPRICV